MYIARKKKTLIYMYILHEEISNDVRRIKLKI